MKPIFLSLTLLLLLSALGCGSENVTDFDASVSTQSPPVVQRINPANGKAGDTITIFGFGFSSEPANNVITIAGNITTATGYALVDPPANGEIESLTFTVPAGASAATGAVFVTVLDSTSNSNLQFTVNNP